MKNSKLFKVLVCMGMGILSVSMMAGCQSATTASAEKGYITMGTSAEFEPFEYRQGEEIVGFDVEIAKAVAEKLGKELKIEDIEFPSLLNQLNAGSLDLVVAGLTINEERAKQVDFSNTYFKSKQAIIIKADNDAIKSADDLYGKTVGVQLGTTGEQYVSSEQNIKSVSFDKGTLAVMDLANGKIDAVVIDEEPAKKMVAAQKGLKVLDTPFVEEEYAIAVQKGDEELLNAINETLEDLKSNGKYDEIYAKYFEEAK